MDKRPKKRVGGKCAVIASLCCLGASGGLLLLLSKAVLYMPLQLAAMLLLLPTAINLLLLLPRAKGEADGVLPASDGTAEGTEEKPLSRRARLARFLRATYENNRSALLTVLIVLAVIVTNVWFWQMLRGRAVSALLSYYAPALLAALFVIFIVFGKWCKHSVVKTAEGTVPEEARYTAALLRSLAAAFAICRVGVLLVATVMMLCLLGLVDLTGVLTVLLAILFVYQSVFMLLSLLVVLVRHELAVAPEITAPMPGVEHGDFGVLRYLEKNTGISMRSLWGISLLRRSLPYAALLTVALIWCTSSFVVIDSNQQGAVYRLGCLQERTLTPGLHMTLPWPFDEVVVEDTATVQQMTVGYIAEGVRDNIWTESHGSEEYRLLLGGGNELVSINLRVEYRVADLHQYLRGTASPEAILNATAYELITVRTISTDLDTLLSADRAAFAETLRLQLAEQMQGYGTGLEVVNVVLESIHPPVEIADVFQALISAEIDADRIILDAEATAGKREMYAQISYDDTVALEKITYYESVAAARAEVAEFMASVEADKTNSDAYRYYKYLSAITKAYGDGSVVIVGDSIDTGRIYIGGIAVGGN